MRKEGLVVFREALITQMNHWILFLVAVVALDLRVAPGASLTMWQWMLCSIVPFVFFLVRRYLGNIIIILITHLLALGLFFVMPANSQLEWVILLLYVLLYAVYSVYLKIKTEHQLDTALNPGLAVVLAACCMFLHTWENIGMGHYEGYFLLPVLIFIGLYFVQFYIAKYQNFIKVNTSSNCHVREGEMFSSGIRQVGLVSLAVVVVAGLVGADAWADRIFAIIKEFFVKLFKMLTEGLNIELRVGEGDMSEATDIGTMTDKINEFFGGAAETNAFFEKMESIFSYVLVGVIILGIIAMIFFIIKFIRKLAGERSKKRGGLDEDEAINDVREKIDSDAKKRREERKSIFEMLSKREQIRRAYKKEVWANRNEVVVSGNVDLLKAVTAHDYGEKMDRRVLASVYEKARYSEEECTAEDVRLAKEK